MKDKEIILTIEKLAGLGDGLAHHRGRKVYVPYTLPGDVVRAHIQQTTKDADYATAEEILTAAKERIAPVCKHFAVCGGCALQHARADIYAEFKQQMARETVRKAGFDPAAV